MTSPRTDPPSRPVSPRRDAVLAALRTADGPSSAEDLAAALHLHPNTARFHLRRLVADGLAEQTIESRESPGRPRTLFRARPDAGGARSYLLLAQMMAETASEDRHGAEDTGRAWGERLLADAGGVGAGSGPEGIAHLHAILDSIGFSPQITQEGGDVDILLHHCPFLEVARSHPGLVCGMHGALIQGVLDGLDSGMRVRQLLPFVETGGCLARVGAGGPL